MTRLPDADLRGALVWLAGVAVLAGSPAAAQRTSENAVKSADDAFGSSVGSERVGLYSAQSARGFNPVTAGNVRIEGMYFDLQAPLAERLFAGSSMRVGLTAQGYPFTSPSGIADFSIRKPTGGNVLSSTFNTNSWGEVELELDGQARVTPRLDVAAGVSFGLEQFAWGGDRPYRSFALIPTWRPTDTVELTPFWAVVDAWDGDAQLVAFPTGDFFPPRIERRRNVSPDWAQSDAKVHTFGLLGNVRAGAWTLRSGLFRSLQTNDWGFTDISLNTTREGIGDRYIQAEGDRRTGSISGELRASRLFAEGERKHLLYFAVRGRDVRRTVGATQSVFVGRMPMSEVPDVERPQFDLSPHSRDHVRQLSAGVGYHGLWDGVGELSLGVLKTDYRKRVSNAAGPIPELKASPWLVNASVSLHAARGVVLYSGFAKGLEDSPSAPFSAVNREEAPPAIMITQVDGGVRFALGNRFRLIAGVFKIEKPYFGLDPNRVYRNLGSLTNQGLEFSATASMRRLNAVAGLVLMNPRIGGDAVDQGIVGSRPVDSYKRYANVNLDYQLPWLDGLSVDLRYENYGNRAANRTNTFVIPARHVVSIGGRYRTKILNAPTTVRAQLASATNHYSPVLFGEGFVYNAPRRLIVSVTSDW